jgi:hypothetical protein
MRHTDVAIACDDYSAAKAYFLRSLSTETGLSWQARRWARFVGRLGSVHFGRCGNVSRRDHSSRVGRQLIGLPLHKKQDDPGAFCCFSLFRIPVCAAVRTAARAPITTTPLRRATRARSLLGSYRVHRLGPVLSGGTRSAKK